MNPARLVKAVPQSVAITTFYFALEGGRPLDYQPGQFIELHLPHSNADAKGTLRQFTLSSSPTEPELAITVKRRQPPSSFKQALWQLQPGARVLLSEPLGDFVLPLSTDTPLVWVAGGIGVTPFRSMAAWLAGQGESRPVQVLHSTALPEEQLFEPLLRAVSPDGYYHIRTAGSAQTRLSAMDILGRLNAAPFPTAGRPDPLAPETLFYVSGPEIMARTLAAGLQACGIPREHIITDAFLGY